MKINEDIVSNPNTAVIEEFRSNAGKVGGYFEGKDMLLLTTTGAKTGEPRVIPLVYSTKGDQIVIIASKGGAPTNPDWYYNLLANPNVTVEIGTETHRATATEVKGEERDRLYAAHAELYPGFKEYEEKTQGIRVIPLFLLDLAKNEAGADEPEAVGARG
jgi:deazaflavin-dependent oxidoreductase (nitroreductase family)